MHQDTNYIRVPFVYLLLTQRQRLVLNLKLRLFCAAVYIETLNSHLYIVICGLPRLLHTTQGRLLNLVTFECLDGGERQQAFPHDCRPNRNG